MQEEFALELRRNVQRAEFARCDTGPQETETTWRSRLYYLYSQTHDDKDAAQIQLNLDNAVTAELPGSDRWSETPNGSPRQLHPNEEITTKLAENTPSPDHYSHSPHQLRDNDLCWYCHNRGHMQKQCPEAAVQAEHFTRFFKMDRMGRPALKKIHLHHTLTDRDTLLRNPTLRGSRCLCLKNKFLQQPTVRRPRPP